MIACLDVAYRNAVAYAAGITFRDWTDSSPLEERVKLVRGVQAYQPGQFFRCELPCLLAVLPELAPVEVVVVDGYVWLGSTDKPGLGAHLYQALGGRAVVVGIAKRRFKGTEAACEVFRGRSRRPLFVTAVGLSQDCAAEHVRSMHGSYRIPTLLKRVDDLSRYGIATLGCAGA